MCKSTKHAIVGRVNVLPVLRGGAVPRLKCDLILIARLCRTRLRCLFIIIGLILALCIVLIIVIVFDRHCGQFDFRLCVLKLVQDNVSRLIALGLNSLQELFAGNILSGVVVRAVMHYCQGLLVGVVRVVCIYILLLGFR